MKEQVIMITEMATITKWTCYCCGKEELIVDE